MYPNGHRGVSLLLYAPFLTAFLALDAPLMAFAGLLTMLTLASAPDKDLDYWFLPHRGPTHSVWFAAGVGVLTVPFFIIIPPMLTGVPWWTQAVLGWFFGFYGIIGHIAGDAITPTGVKPFWPYGSRYRVPITSAKGVWWFETIESGNQRDMTWREEMRHKLLNSNRVLLVLGSIATMAAMAAGIVLR